MPKPTGYGGRDYPDFGISDTFQTKGIISDMGELAARLGAPSLFDRTGTVIRYDQFEGGLNNWILESNPNGNDPVLVASPYLYKPYAVKLSTLNTGAGTSTMQVDYPFPYESSLGIEFAYYPVWPITEIEFYCELYTGSKKYTFDVQYKLVAGEINVYTTGPAYENIYTDALTYYLPNTYNINKIVVDLENKVYNRVMFNKYDISAKNIPLLVGNSGLRPRIRVLIRLEATNLQAEVCYIDNLIFTLDEPL